MTEQVSSESGDSDALNDALGRVRQRALAAVSKYDQEGWVLPKPLALIAPSLQALDLVASDALGERGFVVDWGECVVHFNATYLGKIIRGTVSTFVDRYGFGSDVANLMADRAVGLYVFHELFHINQNFIDHEAAAIVKEAFGPDELSKIDVCADFIAAHCQAIVDQSEGVDQDWEAYLQYYASNITLSYNILMGSFSALAPHKKRRALGLMVGRLLVERAISAGADSELKELVVWPVYASVANIEGYLVALISRENAWEILFYAQVEDTRVLQELWENVGVAPPEDLMALMMPLCEAAIPN